LVFQRYVIAYGSQYLKVVLGSLFIMIIGLTIFYMGYESLGNYVSIYPFERLFTAAPQPYSEYNEIINEADTTNLKGSVEIASFEIQGPGYMEVLVQSTSPTSLWLDISHRDPSLKIGPLTIQEPPESIESLYISTGKTYRIPLKEIGSYKILIRSTEEIPVTVSIRVVALKDKLETIMAKWMQGLGSLMFFIGVVMFILSPLVAARHAHSTYLIAPKEFRDALAEAGIVRVSINNVKKEESE